MKKKWIWHTEPFPCFTKTWRIMRLSVFFLCVMAAQTWALDSYSQVTRLSLNLKDTRVIDILGEIEEKTEFFFLFNQKLVDVERKVDIEVRNRKIDDVLNELFAGTNVNYLVMNRQIVLTTAQPGSEEYRQQTAALQQGQITGRVTDRTGAPLPGVTVVIKGTTTGTITDSNGNYTLGNISPNATLVFSFVGLLTQELVFGSQTSINVTMVQDVIGIEEVVAIGYGTIKKSDLTGSVHRVNIEKYRNQATTNILELLSGTVPGFNSTQSTNASGGGSMEIRGPTSLKASNEPLIVLDGAIYNGTIGSINPSDVESIDILKDASASAVYGSKAAAGVIIITTKRGIESKPTISFSSKVGIAGMTNVLRSFNAEEYLKAREFAWPILYPDKPVHYFSHPDNLPNEISIEEWKNYDTTPLENPLELYGNRIGLRPVELKNFVAGKTTDWEKLFWQNGIRQEYDVSIFGGTSDIKYYWSVAYNHNQGAIKGDEYQTVRSRINIESRITKSINVNLNAHFSDQNDGFEKADLRLFLRQSPYGEMYDENGEFRFYPMDDNNGVNPFKDYTYLDRYNKAQSLFANFTIDVKLFEGLSFRSSYINRYFNRANYKFEPVETPAGFAAGGIGSRNITRVYEWMVDNILSYEKNINKIHGFYFTFLFNAEKYQDWHENQNSSKFEPSDVLSFHSMQSGTIVTINTDDNLRTASAIMGRLNYKLLDRYLATITYRRDGNSAFGQSNPYADFPSLALAWWISEEKFFNDRFINNLKIRTSWGKNGNSSIGMYDALARLRTDKYMYGNTIASSIYSSTMANSNLKWESTRSINIGLDFGIFNNILFGSADLYSMTTNDLLLDRSLPNIIGYSSVAANLGELENRGFEFNLNSRNINNEKIVWSSLFTFAFNRNKIKRLYGDLIDIFDNNGVIIGQKEPDDITNGWFIGESIDRIWDYKVIGVWQLNEKEEAARYNKTPGDHKLQDVNNDGVLLPLDDKVFQGYRTPQYRFGLRNDISFFRNFNLSFFIRADLDFYGQNNQMYRYGWDSIERTNMIKVQYWTPENPSNTHAKLLPNVGGPSYNYYEDRSFIRLQDVSLSYNFTNKIIERFNIKNLNAFISLRNAVTITKWTNWDPESGNTPMPKYSTIGFNVSF